MGFWTRLEQFFSRAPLIITFLILLTALFTFIFWGHKTFVLMAATLAIMLYLGWRSSRAPELDLRFAEGKELYLEPVFYDLKELREFATQAAKRLYNPKSRSGFDPISAISKPSSDKMQEYCVEWVIFVAEVQSIMELEFELINNSSVTAEDIEVMIELPNQWKAGEKLPNMPDRPKTIPTGISVAPTIVGQLSRIEQRLSGSRRIDPEIELEENKVYFYLPHLNPP